MLAPDNTVTITSFITVSAVKEYENKKISRHIRGSTCDLNVACEYDRFETANSKGPRDVLESSAKVSPLHHHTGGGEKVTTGAERKMAVE